MFGRFKMRLGRGSYRMELRFLRDTDKREVEALLIGQPRYAALFLRSLHKANLKLNENRLTFRHFLKNTVKILAFTPFYR